MLNNSTEAISFNYTLISKSKFKPVQNSSPVVYEVIRLINGIPVFFEAHCKRLLNSLSAFVPDFKPDKLRLEQSLRELIQRNNLYNTNIRIDIFDDNILIYEVKGVYPTIQNFEQGIQVSLTSKERENPKEKIYRPLWKNDIEQKLADAKVFELLLVNRQGLITEGSRSNVFFIRDNTLFSAEESLILPGITRSELLKVANELGVSVQCLAIDESSLASFDAAFLCGTSIQILPIAKVKNLSFNVDHALMRRLQKAFTLHFDQEYRKSIEKWRK
jgi:branched-chain amino acid aminotransferase